MSQAATTWQPGILRNALVLFGPCMPQPITPMVMRSCAGTYAARRRGLEAMATVAPAVARKLRREIGDFVMTGSMDCSRSAARNLNAQRAQISTHVARCAIRGASIAHGVLPPGVCGRAHRCEI